MLRAERIDQFLTDAKIGEFTRRPLAADASFRSYDRVATANKHFVLMDAPPPQEDVRPFMSITMLLRETGLHAPEIIAQDENEGLLLLEDFGDTLFSRYLSEQPDDEWSLYQLAIDGLIHLAKASPSLEDVPAYHVAEYRRELEIFTDWYLPEIGKESETKTFLAMWDALLVSVPLRQDRLVLRDYHADNLMWLQQEEGLQRLGVLDYQDALAGDTAYDLVSLLEDARRDVSPNVAEKALAYYLDQSGEEETDFRLRYALLGAQRNLKIIGIFHRLHKRDGKAKYLDYLPRVWAHLAHDVSHPALAELKDWLGTHCAFHLPAS